MTRFVRVSRPIRLRRSVRSSVRTGFVQSGETIVRRGQQILNFLAIIWCRANVAVPIRQTAGFYGTVERRRWSCAFPPSLLSRLSAPQDDAHCRSLLIIPGELVYAQCRLALRKTYLNNYNARKIAIQQQYGVLDERLDQALRADAFCNYDEAVKASIEVQDELSLAEIAYASCGTTRERLQEEIVSATGVDGFAFTAAERPTVIDQNVAAIRESRAVIQGPPTNVAAN